MSFKKRFSSVILWSVVSAAFIGPGTLATATAAGSGYKYQLIWALLFSTLSCLLLQEMSARVAIVSNVELATSLLKIVKKRGTAIFVGLAVILGCVAYEAGNVIGAVSGILLVLPVEKNYVLFALGLICMVLLWKSSFKRVVLLLGYVVAIMGILFLLLAFYVPTNLADLIKGAVIPSLPAGSSLLVLGLIGTTVVPYNLFLGSGVGRLESLANMRFGLSISVLLGGIVSIAILVVATNLEQQGGFIALAEYLKKTEGIWSFYIMAFGLFAAGLTSSLTAPLAAGLIARSIFSDIGNVNWYKVTWVSVIGLGLLFGLLDIKPIPLILAAQAFNGLILPILVLTLLVLVNDPRITTKRYINSNWNNALVLLVLNVTFIIGAKSFIKVMENLLNLPELTVTQHLMALQLLAIPLLVFALRKIKQLRVVLPKD